MIPSLKKVFSCPVFFLFAAVHIGISLVDDVIDIAERRLTDDIAKGSAGSMGLEMFLDAPQQVAGPHGVLAGRDGQEFITAEAEDFILADDFRQYEGDGLDEQVSLLMAKCVIRLLETVNVGEDDGVGKAVLEFVLQIIEQCAPVADAGQLVDGAELVQMLQIIAVAQQDFCQRKILP